MRPFFWLGIFLVLLCLSLAAAESNPSPEDDLDQSRPQDFDDNVTKMTFRPPQLTEEEERSPQLPKVMRCDACWAVSYQLHKGFEKEQSKFSQENHRLSEAEVLEITEKVCDTKTFDVYGISYFEDDGSYNRIKGPGVYDEPGVAQMGGRTPFRLADLCENLMDLDEMRIYQWWINGGRIVTTLREFLCLKESDNCREEPSKDEL